MNNPEKSIQKILEEFDKGIGESLIGMMEIAEDEAGEFNIKYDDIKQFLSSSLRKIAEERDEEIKKRIGMLRQWLNERQEGLLTNEDLEYWLFPREKS